MGPTTDALLHYFQADRAFQQARQKLDNATRSVRIQEGKTSLLMTDFNDAHHKAVESEAKARELELECKTREERIELLRGRQGNATNPKEYQALLVEISTQKVDKGKLEEQAIALLEQCESQKKVAADFKARVDAETAKLKQMKAEIDDKVREITAEMETLRGPRDAIAKTVPPAALAFYARMADRFDGEAMAAIEKPDPRDIEYLCTGCNTYLVANIYNRLMSPRDEIVTCPSCQRILFVPDDLTPEKALAVKAARATKAPRAKKEPGEKKPRAPRKKKGEAAAPVEPGSVAEALAAGASSASGKGPQASFKSTVAPHPSHADGRANTDLGDEPSDPASEPTDSAAKESGSDESASATPTTDQPGETAKSADATEASDTADAPEDTADANRNA